MAPPGVSTGPTELRCSQGKCPRFSKPPNTLMSMLKSDERVILDFERSWWLEGGPKDQAIEQKLGLSASAYYEALRRIVFDVAALAYDPLTVKRVRSLIEQTGEGELAV